MDGGVAAIKCHTGVRIEFKVDLQIYKCRTFELYRGVTPKLEVISLNGLLLFRLGMNIVPFVLEYSKHANFECEVNDLISPQLIKEYYDDD